MKPLAIIAALFLAACACAAATINAASTSLADFNTAYAAASDGDRINIPAGDSTWASRATTITKAIRIFGAGTNATILRGTSGQFKFEPSSDKRFRVSGIQFAPGGFGSSTFANAPVLIETFDQSTNLPLYQFMVDQCFFTNAYSALTAHGVNTWGIFRSNTFINCDIAIQVLGGAPVWKYPIVAATTNALLIELNKFYQSVEITGVNEQITTGQGVRYVVRFNTFDGRAYTGTSGAPFLPYEHHGGAGFDETSGTEPATDKLRGPPILEIYGNTMHVHQAYRHMNLRGGSLLVFSNALTVVNPNTDAPITLTEDDSVQSHNLTWPSGDQISNTHFWSNTINAVLMTTNHFTFQDANDWDHIREDRDFFMHPPDATSGKTTWSDWNGSHQATFTGGIPNWHYPYAPMATHPMIAVFEALDPGTTGGGGGGGGATGVSGQRTELAARSGIHINGNVTISP